MDSYDRSNDTVFVLGADGYLGWPMALRLSALGYRVVAMDNLSKRAWRAEIGVDCLNPVASIKRRIECWLELTGKQIEWHQVDLANRAALNQLVASYHPGAVIHFAEQPSAPYSMVDSDHCVQTYVNNTVGTLNLLWALKRGAPDCHLIKLGSMGEYGCPNIDIEEGWLTIQHNGRSERVPFPKRPHSFYHLSKVADSENIMFACRVWNMRATDLNQGVVYGIDTEETRLHPDLATSFHYDSTFGTALNRFCVQAAAGTPLTVYGTGGQTRGYLNIQDTLACILLSLRHRPDPGEFRVFNQFTEQFSVNELAQTIGEARRECGLETSVVHIENPRIEAESHYYNAKHQALLDLGLEPHLLNQTLITSLIGWIAQYLDRVDLSALENPNVTWASGANRFWARQTAVDTLAAV
ncbi:MAG TPA: NAD-dependent epimerase/dehydratase family protein [Candidatus Micrarchaeia archaeon]|nr:NAD-dependent epimerase/dehydratase family protein [Candidatus Micrarchaeia archaeon]